MKTRKEIEEDYQNWLKEIKNDELKEELKKMNQEEIEESFAQNLEFGTAGLRGVLGAGTGKMNYLNIVLVTQGLANYLKKKYKNNLSVAIASDPRKNSDLFMTTAATVLADNDIHVYIYSDIKPTPMLSFLVREKKCVAGIMITASHNPKEYNGYKVYNQTGSQLNLIESQDVMEEIKKLKINFSFQPLTQKKMQQQKKLTIIEEEFDTIYLDKIKSIINIEPKNISITYSAEHGTGYQIIPKAFDYFNFKNIVLVEEQMIPDVNFSQTLSSNPEEKEAYVLAQKYAHQKQTDLIIVTDPDADRLGVMCKDNEGNYQALTGNQVGHLLINYLLHTKDYHNKIIYKSIVTGQLGSKIAENFGVEVQETLTGFKFIGQKIAEEQKKELFFAYEESYGYLINSCVRDKDAIQGSLLVADMANYYKKKNQTLIEVLNNLYEEYGSYCELTKSITYKGYKGIKKIKKIIDYFQKTEISNFCDFKVIHKIDYNEKQVGLPPDNMIKFILNNDSWIVFRPSGTEPKLKIYLSIKANNINKSLELAEEIYLFILSQVEQI